jgi:putative transposase
MNMFYQEKNNTMEALFATISEKGFQGMGEAVQILMNEAMKIERNRFLGVLPYERNPDREGYANGYKDKTIKTRVGQINLQVPQVRDSDFYPQSLEKGMRSEKALRLALAEMYVQGVSTKRVKAVTSILCGYEVSSSEVSRSSKLMDEEQEKWRNRPLGAFKYMIIDAIYEKERSDGCVVDAAVLIAYGINSAGGREVLGVSVSLSEHEVHWRSFFESLVARGLYGLEMITSDAHLGLKAARKAVFPSVPWQRCQFHLQQNASAHVSKKSKKAEVANDIRNIFNAPDLKEAERLLCNTIDKYKDSESKLADWMENNIPETFTVFKLPSKHQNKLRTSNMAERVNKEIRRRTKVVGIFPNSQSCLRLITAILLEISDDWITGATYLDMSA